MKTLISRKAAFVASAVLLGMGAFTFTYAATYYAGPICMNGRTTTITSAKSQADANAKRDAYLTIPGNYNGECTPGTTPTTPGA